MDLFFRRFVRFIKPIKHPIKISGPFRYSHLNRPQLNHSQLSHSGLFILLFSLLGIFGGCGEVERSEPEASNDTFRASASNRPPAQSLRLIYQNQTAEPPAKVSVSFQLETDTGVPVPNLPAENFTLLENGSQISKDEASMRVTPEDGEFSFATLLVLDFSDSVVSSSLDAIKAAAERFIEQVLPPAVELRSSKSMAIALFAGSSEIVMLSDYLTNRDQLIEMVKALDAGYFLDNSTNLYGAVISGLNNLTHEVETLQVEQPDNMTAGALVLFTDGTDQAARVSQEDALTAVNARAQNISVFTIGLGNEINANVLNQIGSDGFQVATELDDLVNTFSLVAQFVSDEADSFYKLEYCTPKRAGDENTLQIIANQGQLRGDLEVVFSAEPFSDITERCEI